MEVFLVKIKWEYPGQAEAARKLLEKKYPESKEKDLESLLKLFVTEAFEKLRDENPSI